MIEALKKIAAFATSSEMQQSISNDIAEFGCDVVGHISSPIADFQSGYDEAVGIAREALTVDESVAWLTIDSAPHDRDVLLGWRLSSGEWTCEVRPYSTGWRINGVSTISHHSWATHWQPLPAPPLNKEDPIP